MRPGRAGDCIITAAIYVIVWGEEYVAETARPLCERSRKGLNGECQAWLLRLELTEDHNMMEQIFKLSEDLN